MATRGGQTGNKNATKAKPWADAIRRALARDNGALNKAADMLVASAAEGDLAALKELGDRLDGKPTQQTELTGDLRMTYEEALKRIGQ